MWRTTRTIGDLRLSPSAKLAAVSSEIDCSFTTYYRIVLVPLNGGSPVIVVQSGVNAPDWSRDGRYLFYISYPHIPENTTFGELDNSSHPFIAKLNRIEVVGESGAVLKKPSSPKELVEVLAADSAGVRCLPDGSVLFCARQRSFPSILTSDAKPCLFRLNADLKSIEPIAASKGLLSPAVNYFEPNQDGSKIVVPGV